MHCWIFQHSIMVDENLWRWRCLEKRSGKIHVQSLQDFDSLMKAFANARSHGFDERVDEWHLADLASFLKTRSG